jgi:hypothetical protein
MCVGSMRLNTRNARMMGLLEVVVLLIGILDCDTNFDLSSAPRATQVQPIDTTLVSVVECIHERLDRPNHLQLRVSIRKVKIWPFRT